MFQKISIIGTGLIGGSLGLEIKKRRLATHVIGCGRDLKNLKWALQHKLVDEITTDFSKASANADCILLCTPVQTIEKQLVLLSKIAKPGCLIMDVGSTKKDIVSLAQKILPKNIHFVGCHPIAGTEKSGAKASIPGLFTNKKCLITPTKQTNKKALGLACKFWKNVGSNVTLLKPEEHDRILAATSHFPQMVSWLLLDSVICSIPSDKIKKFSGSGFESMTRLASSPASMWVDIFLSNSDSLSSLLSRFEKQIEHVKKMIQKNEKKKLFSFFEGLSQFKESIS